MDPEHSQAIHNERPIHLICIGAGASGLCLAYKLQRSFRNFRLTLYEKNAKVSGTWYENQYPGCACDVPAHNYTYTFEPKPDWSSVYADSQQIARYFEDFSLNYDLTKYIKTRHKVTEARWSEDKGIWRLIVEDLTHHQSFEDSCHILINASGYLNNWMWPNVPGIKDYQGKLVHSADWDTTVSLQAKKVGLIGNGSSAVQILPQIQPLVESLTTFIRSPTWLLPTVAGGQNLYTQQEIENFTSNPSVLMTLRKTNEAFVSSYFSLYLRDSVLQNQTRTQLTDNMRTNLRDIDVGEKLIPSFGVGCRRLTPDTEYVHSLAKNNVKIVQQGVTAFTPRGCRSEDGTEHFLDVIVCATGFDTSFIPRFPIIGLDGLNLQDAWAGQPQSYLGIGVPGFPNMLTFLGPHSPVSNGPTIVAIEAQADYILLLVDRYQTENIHSFCPKTAAVEDFAQHVLNFMPKTVWSEACRSGFKNHTISGRVPDLWPGSTLHYLEAIRELRVDDWDIFYTGNRFDWLGNGISQTEFDPTSDLGYYIRDHDESPFASRRMRREAYTRSGTQPARVLHRPHRPVVVNL